MSATVVNEFTINVATVNGSGSASSNTILAKSIFRMGVMVSPKNLFPSNIAGLPTWFLVRVSAKGYLARSGTRPRSKCSARSRSSSALTGGSPSERAS